MNHNFCSTGKDKERTMRDIHNNTANDYSKKEGMLYLCATPIGNLEDITYRVVRILNEVDLIAAEDTRNSIKLLNHFEIKTPMTSYHEYNKVEKARTLVEKMKNGADVAVITDAGTPGISDPGEELVRQCHEAGITVTSLPGPAACITALTLSGRPTRRFAFEAFLPSDKQERKETLAELTDETRTIILYEAPHRLVKTLKELESVLGGQRNLTICKELTKRYENAFLTTIAEAIVFYEEQEPRGEYVLVIEGKMRSEIKKEQQAQWETMSIADHVNLYLEQGMDKKEAMKAAAKDRGVSKRDIYQELL
jgi:16S rRNA (cytidine1402-2'-O)-methyltransferase